MGIRQPFSVVLRPTDDISDVWLSLPCLAEVLHADDHRVYTRAVCCGGCTVPLDENDVSDHRARWCALRATREEEKERQPLRPAFDLSWLIPSHPVSLNPRCTSSSSSPAMVSCLLRFSSSARLTDYPLTECSTVSNDLASLPSPTRSK
jgi:hypothetical protein